LIISLFRNNRPTIYLLLLVYTFLLRGLFLWHPVFEAPPGGAFLSPFIVDWIKANNISTFALQLADILLIYFEAVILNFILTANNIFVRSSFIPAMVFITLSSVFGEWIKGSAQTIAQLFLMISLLNLFSITGKEPSREGVFYTSLFLSIGSLFYFPVALFLLVIIVGLFMRSFSLADLLLVLIGFAIPYYFIGLAIYYTGNINDYLHFLEAHFYINAIPAIDMSITQELMLIYLLALVIIGYMMLQRDREFKIVKHRRLVFIVLGYFVLSALAGPFIAGSKVLYLQLIVLPASIFVSKIFNSSRLRIWQHVLFLVLFISLWAFQLDFLNILTW
jgi:hypothetical protein